MSDSIENNEYLLSSFDPQTLRVAELRRIFLEHDIDFKSAAKKAELVQIFNEEVKPRAAAWLQAKVAPIPSTNKIETVGALSPRARSPTKTPGKRNRSRKHPLTEDIEDKDELADAILAPPSTVDTKQPASRPRKLPKVEDKSSSPRRESPARKSTVRRKASNKSRDEEMVDEQQQTPIPIRKRKGAVASTDSTEAFSNDNIFQSGSPQAETPLIRRRVSAVPNGAQKLAPPLAKEGRRKTDGPLVIRSMSSPADSSDVEFTFSKSSNYADTPPKSALKRSERFMPPVSQLKASPAFQSAAQRRKENSLASDQLAKTSPRRRKSVNEQDSLLTEEHKEATMSSSWKSLGRKTDNPSSMLKVIKWLCMLGLTAGSAYAGNKYREEKIKAGYCNIDSDPIVTHPGSNTLGNLVNQFRPQCVPCPTHAICAPGFRMTCEDEFQKVESPLSLRGMVPLSPHCVPDTEKLRRIQVIADKIVESLRDRTASVECGYSTAPGDGQVGMSETELHDKLSAQKSKSITSDQFTSLFDHAMEDVKSREEVEISSSKRLIPNFTSDATHVDRETGGSGRDDPAPTDLHIENYYHSTSLANISVACSVRRTFFTVLARYRVELVGLLTLGLLSLLLKNFFQSRSTFKLKTRGLATRVYDELATMKSKSVDNPERFEPHLGVSQLRDSILADEFSYSIREKLWHEVQEIVEKNSNVRSTQAEIQGEWLRAWEWVGAVREITRAEKRRELGLEEGDDFVRPVV